MNLSNMNVTFRLICSLLIIFLVSPAYAQDFKAESALAEGQLFKFQVEHEGIYTITYDLLNNIEGLVVSQIHPDHLQVLVNGGGPVPRANSDFRIDDWIERPTLSVGLGDGSFDPGDYLSFYMEGPHTVEFDKNAFRQKSNPFSFYDYFILKVSDQINRTELEIVDYNNAPIYEIDSVRAYRHWEQERINLQDYVVSTHGSGKTWYGDPFNITRSRDYTQELKPIEGISDAYPMYVSLAFASRAGNGAGLRLTVNEATFNYSFGSVNLGNPEAIVARLVEPTERVNGASVTDIKLDYLNRSTIDEAWLDYITLSYVPQQLQIDQPTPVFTSEVYGDFTQFTFNFTGDRALALNVTQPDRHYGLQTSVSNAQVTFLDKGQTKLQKYILIHPERVYQRPEFVKSVKNQNLHATATPQCLVVYHPDFESAVDKWMQHRSQHSNIKVQKANVFDIYNEFSGGAQDPGAIRDMCRMYFERNEGFEWLLLFGDGSFDYRHINKAHPFASFVPVYETDRTLSPITSFPTDDFYALLNRNEGDDLVGALDISVGRFPVSTLEEAEHMVDKVIRYETSPQAFGEWRLKQMFLADDEDSNIHVRDADEIAEKVREDSLFNLTKVYFDAYTQVSGAGGIRIPDANEKINEEIFKGSLIVNYLGHGGPFGMAQERVLENSQIQSWTNQYKLPLFVTATCTFAPYDDPSLNSSGEILVKKENGGSIALFTTVRPVYSSSNKRLTDAAFEKIFDKKEGHYQTLGEILKNAKNSNSSDTLSNNARKFALLGDPTLKLAIPEFQVITSTINDQNAQLSSDTLSPLETTTITGYIADELGDILTDFNGTLYPTLYDKEQLRYTLGQDPGSRVQAFKTQENVLWKGKVEITNGSFSFSFVLPKSIDPEFGNGKISYYAHNHARSIDAAGAYDKLIIGGLPEDTILGDQPPLISLYLDNRSFENGDRVGPNPILIADLEDDLGINLSSNSLGHEIIGFLDGQRDQAIVLNNFFEPSEENFKAGTILYPLQGLSAGTHTLNIRAWDVNQNFAEAEIHFTVIETDEDQVFDILAYPNPFDSKTCIQFKTNLSPGLYDGVLEIFDLSGRLIEEQPIHANIVGSTVDCIEWAPANAYARLSAGLYFARLKIVDEANNVSLHSAVKKLIYTQAQ